MNRDIKRLQEAEKKRIRQKRVSQRFPPGTCFQIVMRRRGSKEVHGKRYRNFRVKSIADGKFLCESLDASFMETFTLWDMEHIAQELGEVSDFILQSKE